MDTLKYIEVYDDKCLVPPILFCLSCYQVKWFVDIKICPLIGESQSLSVESYANWKQHY